MNDGATRIAANYKFALSYVFGVRPQVRRPPSRRRAILISGAGPQAPAVIVVEDDFLFSPDFFEYFEHNARALVRSCFSTLRRDECVGLFHAGALLLQELDPTLFIISAWNDNGLKGKARGDRTPYGNNATRPVLSTVSCTGTRP